MSIEIDKIKEMLSLYQVRKVSIEDMKLQIEELKFADMLPTLGFEERVQTSTKCKNNDANIFKIESLEKKISYYTIMNKRVENMLNYIENELQREVIEGLYIKKYSKTKVSRKIDRTRKQVENLCRQGIKAIQEGVERSKAA